MPIKKKFLFRITYIFYLLAVIIVADYLCYLSFRKKILPPDLPQETLSELERRVGYLCTDKKSSFPNFKEAKGKNSIRIGCFGDSYTYGAEVNEMYDYPSLLQDVLRQRGYTQIEVINFGALGYGFHQAFILWESVGKKYNLDYIVAGPLSFQHNRDSTFSVGDVKEELFHSRFILNGNDVTRIDAFGKNISEIASQYFRFIPRLPYLRFDSAAPAFLLAPVACMFSQEKTIANPFYYQHNLDKEMDAIDKILLSKMSDGVSEVLLAHYDDRVVNLGLQLQRDNLFATQVYRPLRFPYMAFGGHNSSVGNLFLAELMFACLTNKTEIKQSVIETKNIEQEIVHAVPVTKRKLSEYGDIAVEIQNMGAGRFFDKGGVWESGKSYCEGPSCNAAKNTFSGVASLLIIQEKKLSICDAAFLPLNFELKEGMPLAVRLKEGNTVTQFPLGQIRLLHPDLNMGIADVGDVHIQNEDKNIRLSLCELIGKKRKFLKGSSATILLQDVPVLYAKGIEENGEAVFTTPEGRWVVLRGDGRKLLDSRKLPEEGIVYLSLYAASEKPVMIPFARWFKTIKKLQLGIPRAHYVSLPERNSH